MSLKFELQRVKNEVGSVGVRAGLRRNAFR